MANVAEFVDTALKAVCPIRGVSIGDPTDKATWKINFDPSATSVQRTAALSALAAINPATIPEPIDRTAQAKSDPTVPKWFKDWLG